MAATLLGFQWEVLYLGIVVFFWATLYGSWTLVIGVETLLNVVGCVMIFLIPESPRWLIEKGRTVEAMNAMATIARWNGHPMTWVEDLYVKHPKQSQLRVLEVSGLSSNLTKETIQETLGSNVEVKMIDGKAYLETTRDLDEVKTAALAIEEGLKVKHIDYQDYRKLTNST